MFINAGEKKSFEVPSEAKQLIWVDAPRGGKFLHLFMLHSESAVINTYDVTSM